MDSKSLFLTANADTIYFWSILDVTKGPIVVETPPLSLGVIDDMWFRWGTDFGLPGPDRGEGGKYPARYPPVIPATARQWLQHCEIAHHAGRSCSAVTFLENNDPKPPGRADQEHAQDLPVPARRTSARASPRDSTARFAPTLSRRQAGLGFPPADPPATFVEGSGKVMSTIPPNDFSYFELINDLVQREPADALDPEIMGSLAAIGIVKGKPFNPDARMRKILTEAAAVGTATGRTLNWHARDHPNFYYYAGSAWTNYALVGGYNFETPPPQVS